MLCCCVGVFFCKIPQQNSQPQFWASVCMCVCVSVFAYWLLLMHFRNASETYRRLSLTYFVDCGIPSHTASDWSRVNLKIPTESSRWNWMIAKGRHGHRPSPLMAYIVTYWTCHPPDVNHPPSLMLLFTHIHMKQAVFEHHFHWFSWLKIICSEGG